MSQRKAKWNNVVWEPDGQTVTVEDTQFMRAERGVPKIPYAPCPTPDAKWKALLGVCAMPKWNGAMKGVMACLIECANYYTGKCCPSEAWMAQRLQCDPSTVKRAVARLAKTRFLKVHHRSQPSANGEWQANGYVIGWSALMDACHHAFPWTAQRGAKIRVGGGNIAQEAGAKPPRKDIEEELIEGTYKHKVVHPPSAGDTRISFLNEKEGFQERESVADSAPYPQTPCSPESPSESDAYAAVSGYCTAFDWEHLSEKDFAAAVAAEMTQAGSGLAVVKAATQEAWRAKRRKEQ